MYLLDTCVFSELTKKKPSENVTNWLLGRDEMLFFASAITFGEIKKGVEKMADTARRTKLEQWVDEFLIPRFFNRMLAIDARVADTWGQLVAKSEKKGRILPTVDSLIAATAITHSLRIVTRNTKDFEGLGVLVINPWNE